MLASRPMLASAFLFVSVSALAFLLGRTTGRPPVSAPRPPPSDPALVAKIDAVVEQLSVLQASQSDGLRSLALEIRAAAAPSGTASHPCEAVAAAATPVEARADPDAPGPSPAVDSASVQQVDDLIDQAVGDGEWGPEQAAEFRSLSVELPPEQRIKEMAKVASAINAGKLRLTFHGLPM